MAVSVLDLDLKVNDNNDDGNIALLNIVVVIYQHWLSM